MYTLGKTYMSETARNFNNSPFTKKIPTEIAVHSARAAIWHGSIEKQTWRGRDTSK